MTSDDAFDDLRCAMAAATPTPDPARKADVLARAQAAFDARHGQGEATAQPAENPTQETGATARPTSVTPQKRGLFAGVIDMLMTRTAGALTGTTALVAVGFLFLSPAGQEMLQSPQGIGPIGERAQESRATEMVLPEAPVSEAPDVLPSFTPLAQPVLEDAAPAPEADGFAGLHSFSGEAIPEGRAAGGLAVTAVPTPAPAPASGFGNAAGVPIQDAFIAPPPNTEDFANADDNPLRVVAEDPVSTFSSDVDTASYALVRSSLNRGQLPPPEAVRIEEMMNYFPFDLPAPAADAPSPFQPTISVFETPWNPDTQLVHIGIQGELPVIEDRPPLNLVFLIDTSGSMDDPAKLPLLIQSFRLMLGELNADDEVAIVTYAGTAGVALEPTSASDTATISAALTALQAGGSTNGVGGLEEAYRLAAEMTGDGEVSRVLLATDGDFNVGLSDPNALEDYIADQRDTGIYLSVLGFGRGNLQDDTMQALAQNGNGTAAYIDTLHEAQRVLVDQVAGALFPIADDLKIQVEFNPGVIAEYRLIGYETRALAREDFANDAVDAGELGAGHAVTAIYEVTPVGSPATLVAPLRYAADEADTEAAFADELGFLSLRWKEPGEDESTLIDFPLPAASSAPSNEARFAAAIAGFGQLLRGNDFLGDWSYDEAIALAVSSRGEDSFGYRSEAIQLMRLAQSLSE